MKHWGAGLLRLGEPLYCTPAGLQARGKALNHAVKLSSAVHTERGGRERESKNEEE